MSVYSLTVAKAMAKRVGAAAALEEASKDKDSPPSIASPYAKGSIFSAITFDDDGSCSTKESDLFCERRSGVDIYGVRIIPAIVVFANIFENQSYTETISVQNISKNSISIRIHNPRAYSFRVRPIERRYLLAPGLKITRQLQYTCSKSGIVQSSLPIYIDEKCYDLPLEAYKGQAFVEITPMSVSFGRLDVGSKPVERQLVVRNVSSCATKFLVDLGRNELNLDVFPLKGWIRPHSAVTVHLQLIALHVGDLSSEIWITTDLSQSRVQVEVHACKRSLVARHPNTTADFTLVEFPVTFCGCRRYQTVVVYNMAAAASAFVVLADFGNQHHVPLREARTSGTHRQVEMFNVDPVEGRIGPFQGLTFTIWFQPLAPKDPEKGWKGNAQDEVYDFLCAVRIKRIQVDDYGSRIARRSLEDPNHTNNTAKTSQKTSFPNMDFLMVDDGTRRSVVESSNVLDDISVLLCLYGEAELAKLTVTPGELYFDTTAPGTKTVKLIHITNSSSQMLAFKYSKAPFIDVSPNFKKIKPKATCDVEVTLTPRNLGKLSKLIKFDVMALSDSTDEQNFVTVNTLSVKVYGRVKELPALPAVKFNPGITPLTTHEVGFLTDGVTFASEVQKPRAAMLQADAGGDRPRPWAESDAAIAFPNDRPRTIRPPAPQQLPTTLTIFAGMPRYLPPVDKTETYSVGELMKKKATEKWIMEHVRGTAAISIVRLDKCCKHNVRAIKELPPLELDKSIVNIPQDVLIPLTFVQLYRVSVTPALISFGNVTTNKRCTQWLTVGNNNKFDISAKIIPITNGIQVETFEHFVVEACSETRITLIFHRETLGRYSGTITVVINGNHWLDVAVVAEVVPKSLSVAPERVDFRLPELPLMAGFMSLAVNNPLNTPVNFTWSVPDGSPFKVEPTVGMAPCKGAVWCAVFFEPSGPNFRVHPLHLVVEGVMCHKLKCAITFPRPNVYFLDTTLNIGYVALKRPTVKRIKVFNPDYCDAMFVILNREPVNGVTVEPVSGTIKSRSCYSLTLTVDVAVEGAIEFVIYMNVQNSVTIELRVTGTVVFPQVEITPNYVSLNRVACNSVTRTTLFAENKSKARGEITFDMDEYPQFKVSLSKNHHDPGVPPKGLVLEPGASHRFYLHFIPKDLASYDFYLPVLVNGLVGHHDSARENQVHAKKLKSHYRSMSICESRRGTITYPTQKLAHLVLIDVVVVKPLLSFSDLELNFDAAHQTKSLTATNVSDEPVFVTFRAEDHYGFTYETDKSGVLTPGERLTLTASLLTTIAGSYTADVPMYVNDHPAVYNSVRLSATLGPACVLSAAISEIFLSPVPLGVEVCYMFHLVATTSADALDSAELTWNEYSSGGGADPFTVELPKGGAIPPGATTDIPVKLVFCAQTPVSVKKVIRFCGGGSECGGGEWRVSVSATADNCPLTTHAYHALQAPYSGHDRAASDDTSQLETELLSAVASDTQQQQPPKQPLRAISKDKMNSSSGSSSLSFMSLSTNVPSAFSKSPQLTNKKISIMRTSSFMLPNQIDSDLSLAADEKMLYRKESMFFGETVEFAEEEYIFPRFPEEPAATEYAVHMNQTRSAVEQWLYEQVFNCSYYPVLGSHAFCTFAPSQKGYGHGPPIAVRNVFDVLERICGRKVRRYFTPIDKIPDSNSARALFSYNLYRQLLEFMAAQGALLSHVEPKYLMGYDDYCLYSKATPATASSMDASIDSGVSKQAESELATHEAFRSRSIQCWLDLFLQIIRTLYLGPALGMKVNVHDESYKRTTTTVPVSTDDLNRCRASELLFNWLTHHYNNQRCVVWAESAPEQRTVTNLDQDLEDGLVLIAVTAAYCPYLVESHLTATFPRPLTHSQAYHNTVCLTRAWFHIRLGFSTTPRDFVRPNSVRMMLLVTHLYTVLPSYKPEAVRRIKFTATLNASETQVVKLDNHEESSVTYHVQVLSTPNSAASFVLDDCADTLVLKRKQRGATVTVRYVARNAAKVHAILLLCGACMPPKFGRNLVFTLEGHPVKLPVSCVFNLVSPLNCATATTVTVDSPHGPELNFPDDSVVYDIWITDTEPQPGNLNAVSWSKERRRKIPRRLFVMSDNLRVEGDKRQKSGPLALRVCCFSQTAHSYWLIFMNPHIGDFIVKLVVRAGPPRACSRVQAALDDPRGVCVCEGGGKVADRVCQRTAVALLPCRNLNQWAAVRTMFQLTISQDEQQFWSTYIESNIGFRLLQWMMEEKKERLSEEIELIFKKSKTYKVVCKSPLVTCQPTLHIPNVRAKTFVPVLVHLDKQAVSHSTVLTLTSVDGQEVRTHDLDIVLCD